jgi:hypothetical protein
MTMLEYLRSHALSLPTLTKFDIAMVIAGNKSRKGPIS